MKLYDIIEDSIRQSKDSVYIRRGATENGVRYAVRQVLRDNPDIFWFSHQWEYKEEDNKVYFHYTLGKERCKKAKTQIDDVVRNDFGIEAVRNLSPVKQMMYVYKWLALYCRYNVHSAHNQTIYSVFVYRNSVCTGIAKAAQYLFQLLDIESKLVFGKINNSDVDSRHCWLIVQINGNWYHLDPTFAMPETGNLVRESGVEPITGHDGLFYNFFCTDTATIRQSRIIEDEETLPCCDDVIDYTLCQYIDVSPSRNGHSEGLGCLLSTGSTADIYIAHNVYNSRAIQSIAKVFREDSNHDLMRKEWKIMRECAGEPHLLRVREADIDRGILYIEQATALSELLASHYFKLTVNGFCQLLLDIIIGLKELLRHGIVYRDIHLKNIYLSDTIKNGRNIYKIGDYGSCLFLEGEEQYNGVEDKGGIGSKWYMAPETWRSGVFDERSAVYSVGMVAYHLLNDLYPPLWQMYGEKSHEFRVNGAQLPVPCKLKRQEYEHINIVFLKKATCYVPSGRYDSLNALEKAIYECINNNLQYRNLVIIQGAEPQSDDLKQTTIDFCSTCIVNPVIEVSNGEVDLDGRANYLADINGSGGQNSMFASLSLDDCSSSVYDFACTCNLSFDTTYTEVSFFPKNNHYKEEAGEMLKAVKHSRGLFDWLRNKQKRNSSNKQDSLSNVNSSVFAPSEAKRGDYLMVQVFLYRDGEENAVLHKATEVDSTTQCRNYAPLSVRLKQGDEVKIMLVSMGNGVEIEEPVQKLIWNGHYTDCQFGIFITDRFQASTLISTVMLSVNGVPAGQMMFKTTIVSHPRQLYAEIDCKTFHKIFISYSHKDEQRVKYIAEAYRAQGVDYFFDRHYLRGGDVYPIKIREYIASADLFILCWSKNAAESDYVILEYHQALALAYPQVDMEKATITIHPISIEPRTEYPEDMNEVYNFEEI